ncbi:MAG: Gfo/Idh/MocA family oxidoreductase [Bryobacteraceae bacterium]
MRELRVALLGQGFMGKAHSNALRQVSHFFDIPFRIRCSLLCGRDQSALDRMAARWGWEETTTDWRTAIDNRNIDAVDVCLPNHLHAEVAMAAARAGKIVLCEKPLAMNAAEAEAMAAAARNVPNLVWFNYRRVPAIALAHRWLAEGRLGDIYHYRATYLQQWGPDPSRANVWRMDPSFAGSGAAGDLLSHALDLALWLNGPVRSLSATLHAFTPGRKVDDAALALARFSNGSLGTFEATRFAIGCRNRNSFEIHGSKGMLGFNLERLNHLHYLDATEPDDRQGLRDILVGSDFWKPGHIIGYEHTFIATLAEFLHAVDRGEPFHPNFEDGANVQRLLDAVSTSSHTGQWLEV